MNAKTTIPHNDSLHFGKCFPRNFKAQRKMKTLIIILLSILVTSCAGNIPKQEVAIDNQIRIEKDTFKNQIWIKTPLYLSRQGFTDTFPVQLCYRALYESDKRKFIQLYVTSSNTNWGFYRSANGEDGYSFEFVKIDSDVQTSSNMVVTKEFFGLSIPITYLEKMSTKDWKIKVYGKRNSGVFIVPAALSKTFLKKLNHFEANKET